jgi:hypothetical protein
MALNGLRFPLAQPIKFYPAVVEISNAFHTYSMDDYAMQLIQPAHMRRNAFRGNQNYYYTKVQLDQWVTVIFEYAIGNMSNFGLRFRDKNGNLFPISPSAYMTQYTIAGNNWEGQPLRYVQYKFKPWDRLGNMEGFFQLEVVATFPDGQVYNYLSEWLDIKMTHPNTVLIEYHNSINDYDIYFSANPVLQLRLPAYRRMSTPQFEDVNYRDQNVNLKLLSSRSYRMFDFFIGYNGGISDFHVDKVRFATQCDILKIDDKRYIKSDSGEFSVTPIPNYPLYKLEMQIEEYNPKEAGTFFEDNGLFIVSTGEFPYAITEIKLSDGATEYDFLDVSYFGAAAELLNEADETELLSRLNGALTTFSLSGNFVKVESAIYFQKDAEILTKNSIVVCRKVLIIDFGVTPMDTTQEFVVQQGLGHSAISLYENNTLKNNLAPIQKYVGNFSTTIDVEDYRPGDYDNYRIYLYCNDLQTELYVGNANKTIYNLNGGVSSILRGARFNGGQIANFNTELVSAAAKTLEFLIYQDFGINTIDDFSFDIVNAGDWQNLKRIGLFYNDLEDNQQDNFYITYHDKVYNFYSLSGGGELYTNLQTTSSSPTALSLAQRNAMIADGYTIVF